MNYNTLKILIMSTFAGRQNCAGYLKSPLLLCPNSTPASPAKSILMFTVSRNDPVWGWGCFIQGKKRWAVVLANHSSYFI